MRLLLCLFGVELRLWLALEIEWVVRLRLLRQRLGWLLTIKLSELTEHVLLPLRLLRTTRPPENVVQVHRCFFPLPIRLPQCKQVDIIVGPKILKIVHIIHNQSWLLLTALRPTDEVHQVKIGFNFLLMLLGSVELVQHRAIKVVLLIAVVIVCELFLGFRLKLHLASNFLRCLVRLLSVSILGFHDHGECLEEAWVCLVEVGELDWEVELVH